LQRWVKRLDFEEWDLKDKSTKPKVIHRKITSEIEAEIIGLRKKTGWGDNKIEDFVDLGHTTINKILRKHNLVDSSYEKRKRIKYIRWQRKHPNSL
jgi:hypothetical protein